MKIKLYFTAVSLFAILAMVFFYLTAQIIWHQNRYTPKPSEGIIILGHSLEDGLAPGGWLIQRLEAGLNLYMDGYAPKILVSGGQGPTDTVPVAWSMRDWLVIQGVNPESILVEDTSFNTFENFMFSGEITRNYNIGQIIVVTNDFHMYRAMRIASEFFPYLSGQSAPVPFDGYKLLAYLREPLSLLNHYFARALRAR